MKGNNCGHIPDKPRWFAPPEKHANRPGILRRIIQSIRDYYARPGEILPGLNAVNESDRQQRSERREACVAILVNASEAVLENGEIVISTRNPDADSILIDISDNGLGVPEDDIPHIFEPFFSTKHDTSGIGLGLAIVHGIVKSHTGKIEVKSELGKGTTVSITLPLIRI